MLSGLLDSEILKGVGIFPGESENCKYSGMKSEFNNKSSLREVSGLVQEGMGHFGI